MNKKTDLEEQYDRIYRYCYFKLHRRETAEDITQETFLRYLDYYGERDQEWDLRYLYRIAHNLCVDEYRKPIMDSLPEEDVKDKSSKEWASTKKLSSVLSEEDHAEKTVTSLWLRNALAKLSEEEQEILLLRYANDVPNNVICEMLGTSRFALYRTMQRTLRKLRKELGEEER